MNIDVPLNPDMAQFVRQQLASGRFQSEGELMGAALRLLERQFQAPSRSPDEHMQGEGMTGGRLADSAPGKRRADVDELPGHNQAATQPATRSPRGILADIRSNISLDEFREARREVWASLPRDSS